MTLIALVAVVAGLGLVTTFVVRLAAPRAAQRRPVSPRLHKH